MDWHLWNYPNLRGDPTKSESVRWGHELFTELSTYRPLIALVDHDLLAQAQRDETIEYLLQLLSEGPIQTHLYADSGPTSNAKLSYTMEAGKKIEAYEGWVDVRPTESDQHRLFAWFRDGKPYHRRTWLQTNAYQRILATTPPAECGEGRDAEARIRADAMAMLAAYVIGADIYVTEKCIPHLRGHDPWSRVTVLSPETALPIVGLYLRGQGKFVVRRPSTLGQRRERLDPPGTTRYDFFWRAAEALLPEHERWRIACRESARATGDDTVEMWLSAVIHRMRQTLQARNRLLRRIGVRQDWNTADAVLNELDQILVWVMGAFDVCARVAHVALGLPTGDVQNAGWQRDDWTSEVKDLDKTLGGLVRGNSDGKNLMEIAAPLRNLIHGTPMAIDTVILVIGPNALQTYVPLPAEDRMTVLNAMRVLGGPKTWGVRYPLVSVGERYKRKEDPHLHPGVFVERLLPYVIKLLNELMAAVPVQNLPGVTINPANLSWRRPLVPDEHRVLAQLALDTV
jgi:hypothetical protein